MDFFRKNRYHLLVFGLVIFTGCIKFDDPPGTEKPESPSYESPCTTELSDNEATIFTASGSEIASYDFSSPVYTDSGVDCNPDIGSYEIVLWEPITESRSFVLSYPDISEGQAQIKLRTSNFYTIPMYYSTSGKLYVNLHTDGSIDMEWCDILCKTQSSNPSTLRTSGRVVSN